MNDPLKVLVLGAHPDDAEYSAGGALCKYRRLGHTVKMISVTNGDAGHFEFAGQALADVRRGEATDSARKIGATYEIWDNHDAQLQPTLELRWQIIRELRTYRPDVVLTHRPNDYHPDHRAVGQAVQDASYLVTVPAVCPDVPILNRDPVIVYMVDPFTRPTPLSPDVLISVDDELDTMIGMMACHASQFFRWLPFNEGILESVPNDAEERLSWLRDWFLRRTAWRVERFRPQLVAQYGPRLASRTRCCEAYEISEYAGRMDAATRQRLFPFLPAAKPAGRPAARSKPRTAASSTKRKSATPAGRKPARSAARKKRRRS